MADSTEDLLDRAWAYRNAMASYGIHLQEDEWDDPRAVREALAELRRCNEGLGFVQGADGSFRVPTAEHRPPQGVAHYIEDMSTLSEYLGDDPTDEHEFELGYGQLQEHVRGGRERSRSEQDKRWRQSRWRDRSHTRRYLEHIPENEYVFDDAREHSRYARGVMSRMNPRNPVGEETRQLLEGYARGAVEFDPAAQERLRSEQEGYMEQPLTPSVVGALFPHEGKRDSWQAQRRIPEALSRFDLIARAGKREQPPTDLVEALDKGKAPYASKEAIDYLVGSAGLSLEEARSILATMQASAGGRKSKRGLPIAMQPSSAVCKASRERKLPYRPPKSLFDMVGDRAVVLMLSPPNQTPRVMTWRRGSHIDCDMVSPYREDTYNLLSRALQSAILWVAEKRGRQSSSIYVGTVGDGTLYRVWSPDAGTLSLDGIRRNFSRASPLVYENAATRRESDQKKYIKALEKIGKSFSPLGEKGRSIRAFRPRRQAAKPVPSAELTSPSSPPTELRTISAAVKAAIAAGADKRQVSKIQRDATLQKEERIRRIAALARQPQLLRPPQPVPPPAVSPREEEVLTVVEEEEASAPNVLTQMAALTGVSLEGSESRPRKGRGGSRQDEAKENADTSSAAYWFGRLLGTPDTPR